MTEIWKDVVGYEGLYQVSNLGQVKSLPKTDRLGRFYPEKIKAQVNNGTGYLVVNLKNNGKQQMNYNILSMAIIWQAAEDYREKKMFGLPTDEEEEFFKGDWCAYLLQNMKITGTDILKRLEEE